MEQQYYQKPKKNYNLDFKDIKFETKAYECDKCGNNCEIINIYKDNNLIKFVYTTTF